MLTAPYDHPLNLVTQSILTYASWGITFVMLAIALKKDVQNRSPFFTFLILSSMVAALAEPLYDVGFMLLFYTPGMWSTFTAFDIPQPIWAYSGYAVLYAAPAMVLCERIRNGMNAAGLYKAAGVILLMSAVFEIVGTSGGAYTYWGPHTFRIFEYPLAIGVLETAQVICFSMAAAALRQRTSSPLALAGLFAIFPCTFYLANFGAGAALIIALHLNTPSPTLVAVCSLISMASAALLIRGAARLLPIVQGREAFGRLQAA